MKKNRSVKKKITDDLVEPGLKVHNTVFHLVVAY